jgi:hypothetical protein
MKKRPRRALTVSTGLTLYHIMPLIAMAMLMDNGHDDDQDLGRVYGCLTLLVSFPNKDKQGLPASPLRISPAQEVCRWRIEDREGQQPRDLPTDHEQSTGE